MYSTFSALVGGRGEGGVAGVLGAGYGRSGRALAVRSMFRPMHITRANKDGSTVAQSAQRSMAQTDERERKSS